MKTAQELRRLAEQALRLAAGIGAPDVAAKLRSSAAEYLAEAVELEAKRAPVGQQQQQAQSKKEE